MKNISRVQFFEEKNLMIIVTKCTRMIKPNKKRKVKIRK
jgi:hypothetical protein